MQELITVDLAARTGIIARGCLTVIGSPFMKEYLVDSFFINGSVAERAGVTRRGARGAIRSRLWAGQGLLPLIMFEM